MVTTQQRALQNPTVECSDQQTIVPAPLSDRFVRHHSYYRHYRRLKCLIRSRFVTWLQPRWLPRTTSSRPYGPADGRRDGIAMASNVLEPGQAKHQHRYTVVDGFKQTTADAASAIELSPWRWRPATMVADSEALGQRVPQVGTLMN
uniref:Uncharacterized protein MLCB2548.15 n=1 Tax=Mycobacterium leprae TaxID=1769 RepID=O69536_MYCLR|nr:very hypothetical protein MLCB2548.15 [Mycobacterium leprae]